MSELSTRLTSDRGTRSATRCAAAPSTRMLPSSRIPSRSSRSRRGWPPARPRTRMSSGSGRAPRTSAAMSMAAGCGSAERAMRSLRSTGFGRTPSSGGAPATERRARIQLTVPQGGGRRPLTSALTAFSSRCWALSTAMTRSESPSRSATVNASRRKRDLPAPGGPSMAMSVRSPPVQLSRISASRAISSSRPRRGVSGTSPNTLEIPPYPDSNARDPMYAVTGSATARLQRATLSRQSCRPRSRRGGRRTARRWREAGT